MSSSRPPSSSRSSLFVLLALAIASSTGCPEDPGPGLDSGPSPFADAGAEADGGPSGDAGTPDAGDVEDAGSRDAGPPTCDVAKCGGWVELPVLAQERSRHTATRLDDGRVLIAGGDDWTGTIDEAELFDPGDSTWSSGGVHSGNRYDHSAVLLGDGRVLIAGGFGTTPPESTDGGVGADAGPQPPAHLVTAEVWTPGTGEWTRVGDLAEARASFTLSPLPDGGAIAVGGLATGLPLSVERFNATTNTWSTVATFAGGRYLHTASVLEDDRVLIAGGFTPPTAYPVTAFVYDSTDDGIVSAPALNLARRSHAANVLVDGRVLITGGYQAGPLASAVLFNANTNAWSNTDEPMVRARYAHAAAPLSDGRLLITGGYDGDDAVGWVELFDPSSDAFEAMAEMNQVRAGHTATALVDGRVLVVGGSIDFDVTDHAEAFTP